MYRGGQLRDISEVSEVGVTTIQQFRHLGPFTHPLSSSPSVGHGRKDRKHVLATMSQRIAIITNMRYHVKNCLLIAPIILTESLVYG